MIEKISGRLSYLEFKTFRDQNACVRFYSRKGGVSPVPWDSLNHGGTVGDARENVVENRRRIFDDVQRPVESIFDVWQVHGTNVVCADQPRPLDTDHVKADAILTDQSSVTLFMRFADCVPVVLFDPIRRVIGMVHAGWMGTVNGVVLHAVREMQDHYGSEPKQLMTGIGPSIGPDHYEVRSDVKQQIESAFGREGDGLLISEGSSIFLNLWKANERLLKSAGVEHIEIAEVCTACNLGLWYSHRMEKGNTGRFGAVAFLR
jgi:YfiH family protein